MSIGLQRWNDQETSQIAEVRAALGDLLTNRPQFPDVVGDRKIVRFLRGHEHDVEKAIEFMRKFLVWREEHKVDDIRNNILTGGFDCPARFPKGELILSLIPQMIIATDAMDKFGCPICLDRYDFHPSEVLKQITVSEYITFMIYVLEYRSLILEQLSEERENAHLNEIQQRIAREGPDSCKHLMEKPFGYIANTCVIRDLGGVGFEHCSAKGREIIKAVVSVASNNYPELMRKSFMIKTPWLFDTLWFFIKGLIAVRTINKVTVLGTNYMEQVLKEVDKDSIPAIVGGNYNSDPNNIAFAFDLEYFLGGQDRRYLHRAPSTNNPNNPNDPNPDPSNPNPNPDPSNGGVLKLIQPSESRDSLCRYEADDYDSDSTGLRGDLDEDDLDLMIDDNNNSNNNINNNISNNSSSNSINSINSINPNSNNNSNNSSSHKLRSVSSKTNVISTTINNKDNNSSSTNNNNNNDNTNNNSTASSANSPQVDLTVPELETIE